MVQVALILVRLCLQRAKNRGIIAKTEGTLMRIVICDDNTEFGNELTKTVQSLVLSSGFYNDGIKVEYIHSSKSLISYLDDHEVDILFLDIVMPDVDGFGVAEFIHQKGLSTCLIFVSSFESNVFYSLRYKPFRFIRKEKYKEEIAEALKAAYIELTEKNRYIMITKHSDVIPVRISHIVYAEKEKRSNYMSIYTADEVYRYRGTLSDFEALVRESDFVRASQNAYINMANIQSIKDGAVNLKGGHVYYIADKYRQTVLNKFFEYMRED